MRNTVLNAIATLVLLSMAACAPAAPTSAPTKPAAAGSSIAAATSAPAAATSAPAAATKPAAATPAATAPAKPAVKIKRGGTLNASERGLPTLDPHISNATDASPIYDMIYDSLFMNVLVDPDTCMADPKKCAFEIRGQMVESFQRSDPSTYIFKLRQGVKFHDGSAWNAEVAKWNLDRLMKHPKSIGKDPLEQVKSVEVVDANTLRVSLSAPIAIFPTMLSSAGSMGRNRIVSKEAVDKLGDDEFGRKGIGSGPFKVREWIPDQRASLDKNPDYWEMGADGQKLPYVDAIILRYIPDLSVRTIEFRTGNLDILHDYPLAPDLPSVKNDPNAVVWEWQFRTSHTNFIINAQNSKNEVLSKDLKLRQALAYSIDREAFVKTLGLGYYGSARYYLWSPGMLGYDDTLPKYSYDLNKAKQLLKESTYAGQTFDYLAYQTDGRKFGEVLQQMFQALGVPLTITAVERLAWVEQTRAHNYDTAELGQSVPYEPSIQARNLYSNGLGNYEGHQNKEMDKCMDEGAQTDDPKKRHEAYRRCEQIIYEMAYRHPVYTRPSGIVAKKFVKGITSNGLLWHPHTIWLDK